MPCVAPQLFRYRETGRLAVGPCRCWRCPACARRLAAEWRSLLHWTAAHGKPPTTFITLTLREPLPLWRQAPAAQRGKKAALTCLMRNLVRVVWRMLKHREPYVKAAAA